MTTRREMLTGLAAAGISAAAAVSAGGLNAIARGAEANAEAQPATPDKVYKLGVVSARIEGKPQRANGHTWHFCESFCPEVNWDVLKKVLDPGSQQVFANHFRSPRETFGFLPIRDVRVTHYYEPDPEIAKLYADAFPGVQVATSLEKMAAEVDAWWLGDASGRGEDHFDLIAPALARGLPTFCDKPIGGSVAGTKKILEFARQHKAPLMSSSLFRHQWGTEEALRRKDSGEFGPLQYVIASQGGGYSEAAWFIYGQHPTWMAITLCGAGIEAVSMYARENTCHALLTYPDRMPAEVWYGRPDVQSTYCSTTAHFTKQAFTWTPAIEGNYWLGHHYQMANLAHHFRQMIKTRVEPVPHQEILEVTAVIHAAAKSLREKSRLVELAEVM